MSISPDLGAQLAKQTAETYADAVAAVLAKVARRLARGIDEPGWAEAKLVELHRLREDARAALVEIDRAGPRAAADVIDQAAKRGAKAAVGDLNRAGLTAALVQTNEAAVAALVRATVGGLVEAHPRILRAAEDIYRTTIAEAAGQVTTGAATRREAAQRALDRLAAQGITGFVDTAGRGWDLASYAEMAVRTGSGRAAIVGYTDQLLAHGITLGYVNSGPGPCSLCDPWTGRVLSLVGTDPQYPSVGEAEAAGWNHPNCRCSIEAYLPGVTRTGRQDRPPVEERRRMDADRQEQRYLERGVRQWKQRAAVALDDPTRARAEAKVREWQSRARAHADATSAKRLAYREQVGRAR